MATTNKDIIDLLKVIAGNEQHKSLSLERMEEKIDVINQQVQKTNGRVTKVEEWKNALQAVDQYKKDNPTAAPTPYVPKKEWYENDKLVGAVVAIMLAAAGILAAISVPGGLMK